MAKSSNQKAKILYLMELFMRETDEGHPVSRKVLEEKLAAQGIRAERKSLYNDIETLKNFGMDIAYRKEHPEGYYLAEREFEMPELKLLVDAVQSSRFITQKKSDTLIRKIEKLTSRYEARALQRQVVVADRIKAMNESIYYRVSPWALTWDNENYYLIGYDTDADIIKHFRVDKMLNIELTGQERDGRDEFSRFDLARYTKRTFGMFGGNEETVRIRFHNRFVGVVIDRFGKDVPLRTDGRDYFVARVEVAVSEQFFGWITGLGRDVQIISPKSVVEEYRSLLEDLGKIYEKNN